MLWGQKMQDRHDIIRHKVPRRHTHKEPLLMAPTNPAYADFVFGVTLSRLSIHLWEFMVEHVLGISVKIPSLNSIFHLIETMHWLSAKSIE